MSFERWYDPPNDNDNNKESTNKVFIVVGNYDFFEQREKSVFWGRMTQLLVKIPGNLKCFSTILK